MKGGHGTSSTTKGESVDLNTCPFAQAEDAKSDISGGHAFNSGPGSAVYNRNS